MTFMILGLVLFLFEVSISTNRIHQGIVEMLEAENADKLDPSN